MVGGLTILAVTGDAQDNHFYTGNPEMTFLNQYIGNIRNFL